MINFMNRIRSGIINVTFWESITFMLLIHGDYELALLADLISPQNIEFCIEHFSFQKMINSFKDDIILIRVYFVWASLKYGN